MTIQRAATFSKVTPSQTSAFSMSSSYWQGTSKTAEWPPSQSAHRGPSEWPSGSQPIRVSPALPVLSAASGHDAPDGRLECVGCTWKIGLVRIVRVKTRLPPPQTPFQLLWVLLVLVPLLAFPLVLGPVDPRNKKEMVSKNEDHLANAPSAALYLVLRALPGAAGLCLLFAVFLDVAGDAAAAPPPPPPPTEMLWLSVLYVGEDQSAVPVAEAARLPGSLVERAGAEQAERSRQPREGLFPSLSRALALSLSRSSWRLERG